MTYEEWEQGVPEIIKTDAVWQFYAYRKSLFLYDLAWEDCEKKSSLCWSPSSTNNAAAADLRSADL